jgi:hypothetical protein
MMMALEAVASSTSLSAMGPTARWITFTLMLLGAEFQQRIGERFHGAVHIAFDDDVELFEVADGESAADLIEGDVLVGADALFALQLLAARGDGAGVALILEHVEGVAGVGRTIEGRGWRRALRAALRCTCWPRSLNMLRTRPLNWPARSDIALA